MLARSCWRRLDVARSAHAVNCLYCSASPPAAARGAYARFGGAGAQRAAPDRWHPSSDRCARLGPALLIAVPGHRPLPRHPVAEPTPLLLAPHPPLAAQTELMRVDVETCSRLSPGQTVVSHRSGTGSCPQASGALPCACEGSAHCSLPRAPQPRSPPARPTTSVVRCVAPDGAPQKLQRRKSDGHGGVLGAHDCGAARGGRGVAAQLGRSAWRAGATARLAPARPPRVLPRCGLLRLRPPTGPRWHAPPGASQLGSHRRNAAWPSCGCVVGGRTRWRCNYLPH